MAPSPEPLRVDVVIPVLDEAPRLALRLAELRSMPGIGEVIVVDGGSTDRSVEVARQFADTQVISAERGRGSQLNAGARAAAGDVLLFLHADVSLPADAVGWVRRALAADGVVAGAFRVHTVAEERRSWVRPFLWLADLRSRVSRLPYGDQALFVRREAFERAGGFPDQPLMEDVELARRLWRIGRIVTVPAAVRVSGRRFLLRPLRSVAAMRFFPALYRLGVPARVLARWYGNPR